MNSMLKAQMLATALNVYFSDAYLAGNKINAPRSIGELVLDLTHVYPVVDAPNGSAACGSTFENVGAAFASATSETIDNMLTYAAAQSNPGGTMWYTNSKAAQQLAKDAFDGIDGQCVLLMP
jgi:hypothetical protein